MATQTLTSKVLANGIGLESVAVGDHPILERLYFAARDDSWGTIPLEVRESTSRATADGEELRFEASSLDPSRPLRVLAVVTTRPEGFKAWFRATARAEFRYNRIGWCLLHPASSSVGASIRADGPHGITERVLPAEIIPQPLVNGQPRSFMPAFRSITFERDGVSARFEFAGDLFEIEDQRNWSDASFKTYSTPLALGSGHLARPGMVIEQAVTLTAEDSSEPVHGGPNELVFGGEAGRLPLVRFGRSGGLPDLIRPNNGFVEFNRDRPEPGSGLIIGINGSVHTADDLGVMSTTTTHGAIIHQLRSAVGDGPALVIDPLDFDSVPGEWRSEDGAIPAPSHPSDDPRRHGPFGAAWVVASLSACAAAGATELGYFDYTVRDSPAGALIRELQTMKGAPVRYVSVPRGLAGLGVGERVWIANLTTSTRTIARRDIAPFTMEELPM